MLIIKHYFTDLDMLSYLCNIYEAKQIKIENKYNKYVSEGESERGIVSVTFTNADGIVKNIKLEPVIEEEKDSVFIIIQNYAGNTLERVSPQIKKII